MGRKKKIEFEELSEPLLAEDAVVEEVTPIKRALLVYRVDRDTEICVVDCQASRDADGGVIEGRYDIELEGGTKHLKVKEGSDVGQMREVANGD